MRNRKGLRVRVLLLTSVLALVLGACGGASTGSTWFNLPSVTVNVRDDGSLRVMGIPVGTTASTGLSAVVDPLQAAGADTLEVRIGYNGIHIYLDGQDLPYIAWDEDSAAVLATIIEAQSPGLGADELLDWVRRVGVGVRIQMSDTRAERWRGETSYTPMEAPAELVGPMDLSGLAFDGNGVLTVEGVDLGLGALIPAHICGILSDLGTETVSLNFTPNTLDLALNGQDLPSLAYDSDSLAAGLELASALLANDPATLSLVESFLPKLPALAISGTISFTGQAAGSLALPERIVVPVNADGTLGDVMGLPLGAILTDPVLPADMIGKLTGAGITRLDVSLSGLNVAAAVDGAPIPEIALHDGAKPLLASLAPLPDGTLELVETLTGAQPLNLVLSLPGDASDTSVSMLGAMSLEAPSTAAGPLVLPITITGNAITGIGGPDPAALGLGDVALPDGVLDMLGDLGITSLTIVNSPNSLVIETNGSEAVGLAYDAATMTTLVGLLPALVDIDAETLDMAGSLVGALPGLDLTVTVSLSGPAPGSLTLPEQLVVTVNPDGTLGTALGLPVGSILSEPLLPADLIGQLAEAGINRLDLQLSGMSVQAAVNGALSPTITIHPGGAALLPLPEGILDTIQALTATQPLHAVLSLPGDMPGDMADPFADASLAIPDLASGMTATVRLPLTITGNTITDIGGPDPAALGLGDVTIPDDVLSLLHDNDVTLVRVVNSPNSLVIETNGEAALELAYDGPSLLTLLALVPALTGADLISNDGLMTLLEGPIMDQIVAADAQIEVNLE